MVGKAASGLYADEERGGLRVTAHSALPFLVGAVVSADRSGSRAATPWRAGFVGAHLVHVRQIIRLVRGGGAREPEIRGALALGSVGYALVLAQIALLSQPAGTWAGSERAARWSDAIDRIQLWTYAVAGLGGLVRHRRPLSAYAVVAALLAIGFGATRRSPGA
ncbi:MAG TPA: hypothetical protein VFI09_00335 [Solirubrobacterales bacterium]|nr:hypothetical protein [Solirubrobacterales bacterium]